MDYKKKYEQALENIKKIKAANKDNKELVDFIEYEYPELKENKDEMIRNFLISKMKEVGNVWKEYSSKDIIAWLEKQGEKKPFDYENANIQQKDFAPKGKPKFKAGDWVVPNNGEPRVSRVEERGWPDSIISDSLGNQYVNTFTLDKQYHLWTIQDAKAGDVLYSEGGGGVEAIHLVSSWKIVDVVTLCSVCTYRIEDNEIITGGLGAIWWQGVKDPFYPATKEQRDLLFSKMKEAGYEWDAEKKELKKVESKSAWSEEDEKEFKWICVKLQEHHMSIEYTERVRKAMSWLKSLKERYTWKPSESDILLLERIVNGKSKPQDFQASLGCLIGQLKKLMEE